VYNFVRAINILSVPDMLQKIKNWIPNYRLINWFVIMLIHFKANRAIKSHGLV